MSKSDRDAKRSAGNHRVRKKRRPPLYWILRGLMIVSFCCFLVFLGQLIIPKIQARSVSSRIPRQRKRRMSINVCIILQR